MKKVLLISGVLLLMSVGLVGCESGVSPGSDSPSSIAGTYVLQPEQGNYETGINTYAELKLNKDSTFSMSWHWWAEEGEGIHGYTEEGGYAEEDEGVDTGIWEVEGNELLVTYAFGKIWDDEIFEEEGCVWEKKP